jgi:hypothetical protein
MERRNTLMENVKRAWRSAMFDEEFRSPGCEVKKSRGEPPKKERAEHVRPPLAFRGVST